MRWLGWLCLVGLAACLSPGSVTCIDGRVCPAGGVCDDVHRGCALREQIEECAGQPELAACSYSGVPAGTCFEGVCLPAGCGNGAIDVNETCDDRNRLHGDGCSADCMSNETCGNRVIDAVKGEACDDGNNVDGDTCQADCASPTCGDGVVDTTFNEGCDDGAANSQASDAACRTNCQRKRCGDAVVDTGEICDDGNLQSGDGCSGDCLSDETCGNGYVDLPRTGFAGEQCDDGNNTNADGCQGNCKMPYCGDNIVDQNLFEECDDGIANANSPDACRTTCRFPVCGDMIEDAGEACDDRNHTSGDGCSGDCLSDEVCGNDYIDSVKGETCDDVNELHHDGCDACRSEAAVWAQTPSAGIVVRAGQAMAYDAARGQAVMFGGQSGSTPLNDTLVWNGRNWTNLSPPSGNPAGRYLHSLAFDASRGRVVLFGGLGSSTSLNDTWEWNGSAWTNVSPAAGNPAARHGHAFAYDAARRHVVMFGGNGSNYLADTWQWNGSAWTNVSPAGANPPARLQHAMAYDAKRDRLVLFGGQYSLGDFADTWEWNGATWSDVTPASGNPAGRYGHTLTYDAKRGRIVLFGGRYGTGTDDLNDIWEWDGTSWANVTPASGSPGSRNRHGAAYDIARDRTVIFGGNVGSALLNDTYEWDGSAWANLTPTGIGTPIGRRAPASAYDASRGRMVLFGGSDNSNFLNDTWELDEVRWRFVTSGAGNPTARYGTGLVYDAGRRKVTMFGGQQQATGVASDTWTWDGSAWTDVTPVSGNPPPRALFGIVYDSARDRVLVFGGIGNSALLNDTWAWNGTAWSDVTPTSAKPTARWMLAMAYDAARDRVVMFGGQDTSSTFYNDTWEWNGTAWTNVTPAINNPGPRVTQLAYDASRGRVVMFGGWDGTSQLDEMWEWDGTAWTKLLPASSVPAARFQHTMSYDPIEYRTIMFGASSLTNDTWTFRYHGGGAVDGCLFGLDGDNDGLVGCSDPDCFGRCTPSCNPTLMTCTAIGQRCGDGVCVAVESARMCPADCGDPTAICGDFLCDAAESVATCPGDCTP